MLKSFVSAGHHKNDSGAVNKELNLKEADLTIEFRDMVIAELEKLGATYTKDKDDETLGQYLSRIRPGYASVTVDYHFDSSTNPKATGSTSIVANKANKNSKALAKEMVKTTSKILGIRNRGVIPESKTYRGRLGILRKEGVVVVHEIGFISNASDMAAYEANKLELAKAHALLIKKYDDLI